MSKVTSIKTNNMPTIEIGGKVRTLKFDLNAFAELENKYGSVQKAMDTLQNGSIIATRTILWAGLIHEEAVLDEVTGEPIKYNITPYMVGSWFNPNDMDRISTLLNTAMESGLPPVVEAKAADEAIAGVVDTSKATVVLTPEEAEEERKNV